MKMSQDVRGSRLANGGAEVVAQMAEASTPPIRPESAAAYIADITTELAGIARGSRLDVLAYLLDIAQLEAANATRRLAREALAR
jgi:hypothetical protein